MDLEGMNLSRGQLVKRTAFAVAGLTALGAPAAATAARRNRAAATASADMMADLVAAAKKEGGLNTIALPPDWANYGEIMSTFQKMYGIKITNANPNGSSAEENQAIVSLKGQKRAPDVVDVGPAFAIQGAKDGLYAPYKVSTWATIPASMKDASGMWVGDYWGVISFGVNTKIVKNVPTSWADLLKPEYKNQVALNGDPLKAGAAFAGVYSAALANGGSLGNISPGIDFFKKLKDAGNYIPVDVTPATIASGQTPITIDWDYLNFANAIAMKKEGVTFTVAVPKTGVYGAFYAQAINATAPNPNAAKLWQEFLYSDEGQLLFLKGGTHPARFADLAKRGKVPAALLSALPSPSAYAKVRFANSDQQTAAKDKLATEWPAKVSA
jgi:putative spermidine/putrescine transport system substrate-binding protein